MLEANNGDEILKFKGIESCCPLCQSPLVFQNKVFHCKNCYKNFNEIVFCKLCHSKVRVTVGCGSATYYCLNDKLLSRKQCYFTYQEYK